MIDLCLINGKIYRDGKLVKGGVAIDEGKIETVSKKRALPDADKVIDLENSVLLPGVVDPHVHFRDPGMTEKEDFFTGSKAAVAGGVTTICDMPNTVPPTDTVDRFREKKRIGQNKSIVDFGLHGMLSEKREEGRKMLKDGAVSLKLYSKNWKDSDLSSLENKNSILTVHPEDPQLLKSFQNRDGGIEDFIESRPREAEVSAVRDILERNENSHTHFCHVTASESLDLIEEAKEKRDNISSEVTPHHLLLDRSHLEKFGPIAKMYPPLRTERDRKDLLNGLRRGVVDIVATDHAPHTQSEKERGMEDAPGGVVGVETSLPLLFTMMRNGDISLRRLVESMCINPADIFGLRNEEGVLKGTIQPGGDADLVAIDQDREWMISGDSLHGKTDFTPFEGWEVTGKPFLTLIRGEVVFREGEIVGGKGHGKFIPRRE